MQSNWVQALGTVLLGLVGVAVAQNLRRQVRVKLIESQLSAYVSLWSLTRAWAYDRTDVPTERERKALSDAMSEWYFENGNGIFLSQPARELYVGVKANLVADRSAMFPSALAATLDALSDEQAGKRIGCTCLRQVSMLRAQLKTDMTLHSGYRYFRYLSAEDRAFLESCGLSLAKKPWRPTLSRPRDPRPFPCICGLCS